MDQIKIGKFIQEKRKEKNITQSELAEKLGITDRAISKWERGICLPDASNMRELCELLGISINDLFSGEEVSMKEDKKQIEENLLLLKKENEDQNKMLLNIEVVLMTIISIFFIGLVVLTEYLNLSDTYKFLILCSGFILFIISALVSVMIEQKAGYYECSNCGHKYIPTFKSVLNAKHIMRTRKMKCPKCNDKCWHKKVIK